MIGILSHSRDVYFNLAAEEYLLKQKTDDVFMLWQSDTSVVVGKHQNTFAEINYYLVHENHIPVARRLSGGGTVFHGPGNLNFTFIRNGEPAKLVNFRKFITPIIKYLETIGLHAEIGSKNELLIGGVKISGNAEHIFKNKVLHHGTLLYNANLEFLMEYIKPVPGRYIDKAVQSNRSAVANISSFLNRPPSIGDFLTGLLKFLQNYYQVNDIYIFNKKDLDDILQLRDKKYCTPAWIYSYSPPFEVRSKIEINEQKISLKIKVEKGVITDVFINDATTIENLEEVSRKLLNQPFEYSRISQLLSISGLLSDNQLSAFLRDLF